MIARGSFPKRRASNSLASRSTRSQIKDKEMIKLTLSILKFPALSMAPEAKPWVARALLTYESADGKHKEVSDWLEGSSRANCFSQAMEWAVELVGPIDPPVGR